MKENQSSKKNRKRGSLSTPAPFFSPDPGKINPGPSKQTGNLNNSVRGEMEHFFGENLSSVQLKQESLSGPANILAGAQGENIVMDKMIPSESLLGKALLAHELTHVLQQRADSRSSHQPVSYDSHRDIESEANSVGLNFLKNGNFGGQLKEPIRKKTKRSQFHACTSSDIEAPSYLGPHSRQALQDINDVVGNMKLIMPLIIVGVAAGHSDPVGSAVQGGPGGDINAAAEAARAIPTIQKYRITQIIDFLMLDHQNELNPQEMDFWRRIYQQATGGPAPY